MSDQAMGREDVLEQYKEECMFLLYGHCETLGCLKRGGYIKGGHKGIEPTCAAREAVEADALREELAQVKVERAHWQLRLANEAGHCVVELDIEVVRALLARAMRPHD
jgi:hypothetical protein